MDSLMPLELEGQRSINELLDEPIGDRPIQLELPIPGRLPRAVKDVEPQLSGRSRLTRPGRPSLPPPKLVP
jgi:hypothetical protein